MKTSLQRFASAGLLMAGFVFSTTLGMAQTASVPTTPPPGASNLAPEAPATHPFRERGALRRLGFRRELAEKLGLSEEQKAQMKSARQAAADQMRAVRADTTLTPEDKKARVRDILASTRQQMKQMLTPEQQQKLAELRDERQARQSSTPADSR